MGCAGWPPRRRNRRAGACEQVAVQSHSMKSSRDRCPGAPPGGRPGVATLRKPEGLGPSRCGLAFANPKTLGPCVRRDDGRRGRAHRLRRNNDGSGRERRPHRNTRRSGGSTRPTRTDACRSHDACALRKEGTMPRILNPSRIRNPESRISNLQSRISPHSSRHGRITAFASTAPTPLTGTSYRTTLSSTRTSMSARSPRTHQNHSPVSGSAPSTAISLSTR